MRLEDILSTVPLEFRNLVGQRWAEAYDEFTPDRARSPLSSYEYSRARREYALEQARAYAHVLRSVAERGGGGNRA